MPSQSYSMNGYNGTVRAQVGNKQVGGSAFVSGQQDKLSYSVNVMTSYKMTLAANAADASLLDMEFFYNGTSKCLATCQNPFLAAGLVGDTFIGFHAVSASSWVILKSCDVTVTAEE